MNISQPSKHRRLALFCHAARNNLSQRGLFVRSGL